MELLPVARDPLPVGLADLEADDGDEVELTLGLAVGGSSRKALKPRGSDGDRRPVPERAEGSSGDRLLGRRDQALEEDRPALEAQMLQSRARDRAVREEEAFSGDRPRRGRTDGGNGSPWPRVAPFSSPNPNPHTHPFGQRHPSPVMAYPYHQVQYVPVPNGFGFPYVVPCWAPTISAAAAAAAGGLNQLERNVYQPVACHGLPVQATAPKTPCNGVLSVAKETEAADACNIATKADSAGSSSSAISNRRSGSVRGGSINSGDCKIKTSTQKAAEKPAAPKSAQEANNNKLATSNAQSCLMSNTKSTGLLGGPERAASVNKPARERNAEKAMVGHSLPRMPLVATTGNGPNGRTINGFLYRYTKSDQVKILCVCHGSSFTPAEFVRHAGGTNVSQPLRQIVVVAS